MRADRVRNAGASVDRQALDAVFDDLLAAGVSESEIMGSLDIPMEVIEREMRNARRRLPPPIEAGCTMMITFPDTDEAWTSTDGLGFNGTSSGARSVLPDSCLRRHGPQ